MAEKDKKIKKEVTEPCQVCRVNYFDNQDFEKLLCKDCHKTVHRYCYAPDIKEKNKFKCDECKKKGQQKNSYTCSYCGKQNGILKDVGMGQWMHMLCALTSPRVKLNSYKTLTFAAAPLPLKKPKISNSKKCMNCNSTSNEGLHCWKKECKNYIHMDCVLSYLTVETTQNYSAFLTIGLLDKHQDSLLFHLNKNIQNFRGLSLIGNDKEEIKYLVCSEHNDQIFFIWCPCNQVKNEESQIECEKCKRWFHTSCAKMKQGSQICFGCRNNDIYARNLKLPQLIHKIQDIQGSTQLDKPSIKFLDHFSLKLSESLQKILLQKKNIFEIERYYLRKALESSASILQKNINSQNSQEDINIVEIIYYLLRKEIKKESDISFEELSQICHQLSNKNSKFDWGQEKGEKIEKKYKKYLEQKLKEMQSDDSRTIKPKLKEFARRNKEPIEHKQKQLAIQIQQIISMMKNSEVWKQIYQQYCEQSIETDSRHLLQLFYDSNLDQQGIAEILLNFKLAFKSRKLHFIKESDYNRIVYLTASKLDQQKSRRIRIIFKELLSGVKIHRMYDEKRQLLQNLENTYGLSKNTNEKRNVQDSLVKNNILVPSNSVLFKAEADLIQFAIIRKKYLNKPEEPNASQLIQSLNLIDSLIKINQKVGRLKYQQFSHLMQVRGKYMFYANILSYYTKIKNTMAAIRKIQSGAMEEELSNPLQENQNNTVEGNGKELTVEPPKSMSQTIRNIIKEWVYSNYESVDFAFNQLFQIAKYQIKFDQNEVCFINSFIEIILQNVYKRIMASSTKIKGEFLTKIGKIVTYAHLQQSYCDIIEIYSEYVEWKQQLQDKFINIEQVLQDRKLVSELLLIIEAKQIQAEDLDVDTTSQLKKLHVLKMWACLSQKILSFQKTSITSITNLKSIMDKISYPKNRLRERIEKLEIQSRNLNQRIAKIFQKPKIHDMEIYQQLTFVKNKMTFEEAQQLRGDLEASELYVEIQLQTLMDYIKQFKGIPADINQQFYSNAPIEDLLALQKKILESPFMCMSIENYYSFVLKIYKKKCEQTSVQNEDIFKKDYFRFLYYGGPTGAEFYSETMQVHKAYKDIEIAENQLPNGRVKYENLLPSDGRKIKSDLKEDPIQRAKVERWYQSSERLREKYRVYRVSRAQFERYLVLQGEFNRLPINNRQITTQIGKIKRQIEELTSKAKKYLGASTIEVSTLQFENPYTSDIVNRYRMNCARTDFMDRFEFIYMKNKEIMELGRNITIQNYRLFSKNCQEVAELMNNNEVYRIRQLAFQKMWKIYLQSSEPLMQIGCTLLTEGGALCRYPNKSSDIIPIMLDVNNKFFKWNDHSRRIEKKQQEQDEISEPQQDENGEHNQDDQQESGLMGEFDQDLQLEDEDEDQYESSSPPIKKKTGKKQIVQLDDD